jgi:hypothetical protein
MSSTSYNELVRRRLAWRHSDAPCCSGARPLSPSEMPRDAEDAARTTGSALDADRNELDAAIVAQVSDSYCSPRMDKVAKLMIVGWGIGQSRRVAAYLLDAQRRLVALTGKLNKSYAHLVQYFGLLVPYRKAKRSVERTVHDFPVDAVSPS